MKNTFESKSTTEGRIAGGVILVTVGAALLLRNMGFPLPYWLFTWPMILILVGIHSGIKHRFSNMSWIIITAIGCFFLADKVVHGIYRLQVYFWPVIIIAAGILFIVKPGKRKRMLDEEEPGRYDYKDTGMPPGDKSDESINQNEFITDSNNYIAIDSVFSGVQRKVVTKNFLGGRVSCVFGGADIDLTQADIKNKTELKMDVVFGGVKLIVPPHWTIFNELGGVFHGVDDKRKFSAATEISPEKILVLRGSVVFGGVDIKSY